MNTSKIKVFEEESGHPFEHWDGGDAPLGTVASTGRNIRDAASFMRFIHTDCLKLLREHELPAILAGLDAARRNASGEILELDQWIKGKNIAQSWARPSRLLAMRQLNRLRTLRDVRCLGRYREAIDQGSAHGWHTLVYGMVLHTFSIPSRYGLARYQREVMHGFGRAAAKASGWPESQWRSVSRQLDDIPLIRLEEVSSIPLNPTP